MAWQKEPPTEPGWYWVRVQYEDEEALAPAVVCVQEFLTTGKLMVEGTFLSEYTDHCEWWSEPLEPPA